MAIYRKVNVTFWTDVFVESLTPEQKFFYLYLLTNDKTKQCGIYQISYRQMSFDTGYNTETVDKLLKFFVKKGKIGYDQETSEVAMRNWRKYNDDKSPKVKACINKELLDVKSAMLLDLLSYEHPGNFRVNSNFRVSDKLRDKVFEKYDHKCQKCGSVENLSIDHILPRSYGGNSAEENLRLLCRSCNSKRPLVGQDLIDEITASGFDYAHLLNNCRKKPYEYSIGRQTQEEETQEEEETQAQTQEAASPAIKERFIKPTKEDIEDYLFTEKNLDSFTSMGFADRFFNYYEANGWKVGRNPMKNWKAAVNNWLSKNKENGTTKTSGTIEKTNTWMQQ